MSSVCLYQLCRQGKPKIQIYVEGQKSLPKIIILIAVPFTPFSPGNCDLSYKYVTYLFFYDLITFWYVKMGLRTIMTPRFVLSNLCFKIMAEIRHLWF